VTPCVRDLQRLPGCLGPRHCCINQPHCQILAVALPVHGALQPQMVHSGWIVPYSWQLGRCFKHTACALSECKRDIPLYQIAIGGSDQSLSDSVLVQLLQVTCNWQPQAVPLDGFKAMAGEHCCGMMLS